MSDVLRVALVAEGPTDRIVIQAAIEAMIPNRSFILRQIHPEESAAFGEMGTGWVGVYRWCRKAVDRRNKNDGIDPIFANFDLLLLHLDADVAGKSYTDNNVVGEANDLPCELPCPPPRATTDALRVVLARWFGADPLPFQVVVCMPSKSTESWVVAAVFPNDAAVASIECNLSVVARLGVQPIAKRIRKTPRDYHAVRPQITAAWPRLVASLSEAQRFHVEFGTAIAFIPQ